MIIRCLPILPESLVKENVPSVAVAVYDMISTPAHTNEFSQRLWVADREESGKKGRWILRRKKRDSPESLLFF
jgi:hypothetical protein